MLSRDLLPSFIDRQRQPKLDAPLSDYDRMWMERGHAEPGGWLTPSKAFNTELLRQDDALKGRRATSPAVRALGRATGAAPQGQNEINRELSEDRQGFAFNQLAIENALDDQSARRRELLRPTPEQDLFSGRTEALHRKVGDIELEGARRTGDFSREEFVRNAGTQAAGEQAKYFAPGQDALRQQQLWDREREQQTLYPYSPAALAGQSRLGVADINAGARLGAADLGADARLGAAALQALGRLGTAPIFTPQDQAMRGQATEMVRPSVPGQAGAPAAPGQPPQQAVPQRGVFPAAALERFAGQNGFLSPAAAAEYLRSQGYVVQ